LWEHVLISKVFFAGMTIANSKVERSLQWKHKQNLLSSSLR
jgi:hypothetical protein